jgi:hypothetical protein
MAELETLLNLLASIQAAQDRTKARVNIEQENTKATPQCDGRQARMEESLPGSDGGYLNKDRTIKKRWRP